MELITLNAESPFFKQKIIASSLFKTGIKELDFFLGGGFQKGELNVFFGSLTYNISFIRTLFKNNPQVRIFGKNAELSIFPLLLVINSDRLIVYEWKDINISTMAGKELMLRHLGYSSTDTSFCYVDFDRRQEQSDLAENIFVIDTAPIHFEDEPIRYEIRVLKSCNRPKESQITFRFKDIDFDTIIME